MMTLEARTDAAMKRAEGRYSREYLLRTASGAEIAFKAIRRPPSSIQIEDSRHVLNAWEFLVSREWLDLLRTTIGGENALFNEEEILDGSTVYTLDRTTPFLAMSGTEAYYRLIAYKRA